MAGMSPQLAEQLNTSLAGEVSPEQAVKALKAARKVSSRKNSSPVLADAGPEGRPHHLARNRFEGAGPWLILRAVRAAEDVSRVDARSSSEVTATAPQTVLPGAAVSVEPSTFLTKGWVMCSLFTECLEEGSQKLAMHIRPLSHYSVKVRGGLTRTRKAGRKVERRVTKAAVLGSNRGWPITRLAVVVFEI